MRSVPVIIFFLFSFFIIDSFGLNGINSNAFAASFPHLSTKHKISPSVQKQVPVVAFNGGITVIKRSGSLVKRRPNDYGKVRLSSTKLRKKVSAKSAIILNARTEEIIYAHSPDKPGQPASTIKVLTGIIAIDSLNDREMVSVSRKASRMPRSKIYLRKGKKYPADDLVNAVLLASANDASVALAEKIAGSESVFAKLMTAKARSFGARNTVCKTASGLTARKQKSTARDLAMIFKKAMENNEFASKLAKRKIKNSSGSTVYSHNKALWKIGGAIGGKTGYTNLARQTYVGKFKRDGVELIVAFLGSETMWSDAKRLVEYGFLKEAEQKKAVVATTTTASIVPLVQLGSNSLAPNPLLLSKLR